MAFVPKRQHDLFISYASADPQEWIAVFRARLGELLSRDLGDFGMWVDKERIRVGDVWPDKLGQALKDAACLLALCSPEYYRSDWCTKERQTFLEANGASEADLANVTIADQACRFIKVLISNNEPNWHEIFLPTLHHRKFFDDIRPLPFATDSREFDTALSVLAGDIAALLRRLRNASQPIFLGYATQDVRKDWNTLSAELKKVGFDVRPEHPISQGYTVEGIAKTIISDDCSLAVFLLGASFDQFVRDLAEMINSKGVTRKLYWVNPRLGRLQPPQAALKELLVEEGWEELGSASVLGVRDEVARMLSPQRDTTPRRAHTDRELYLLYDRATTADVEAANVLERIAQDRRYVVRHSDSSTIQQQLRHKDQFFDNFDGVMLSHVSAPRRWLLENLIDMAKADDVYSCCVMSQPSMAAPFTQPQVMIVPRTNPLPPEALLPFFTRIETRRR